MDLTANQHLIPIFPEKLFLIIIIIVNDILFILRTIY